MSTLAAPGLLYSEATIPVPGSVFASRDRPRDADREPDLRPPRPRRLRKQQEARR
jgi:hypothetical protein